MGIIIEFAGGEAVVRLGDEPPKRVQRIATVNIGARIIYTYQGQN
jgi:hypothetical protein